jgi:MoxR-like ATPase
MVSGETGIGKSRLAAAFAERLSSEPHIRLRYLRRAFAWLLRRDRGA